MTSSTNPSDFQEIVGESTAFGGFVHLQLFSAGNIAVYTDTGWIPMPIVSQTPNGVFRHLALCVQSGNTRLYVDGALVGQSSHAFSSVLPTSNLRIGSGYAGSRYFHGLIDEVSIYGRALTEAEVQAIHQAGSAGKRKTQDADGDGLVDAVETNTGVYVNASNTGTDPNDPDTDDDGLLDGTEVELAAGSACPSPLVADSDGDTLSDGHEALQGTNPCSADSDGDGIGDAADDFPTTPGVSSGLLENLTRALGVSIQELDLALFNGPNPNANRGRRTALANRTQEAANAIAATDRPGAVSALTSLLQRVDDVDPPPDWMSPGAEKVGLAAIVRVLLALLAMALP